jgi:hypothetical protein
MIAATLLFLLATKADDDPVEVLMRVRDRVLAHATRVQNHTCVETIVRDWYDMVGAAAPASCDALLGRRKRAGEGTLIKLATTDRLRLDVGVAESREIYSWAGAGKFEQKELVDMVPIGAIGTGPFAATLLGLFQARDPHFVYEGDTTLNSKRVLEYSFTVLQEESNSRVKAGPVWVITGYTGRLLVDPATAELLRLTVRTEELPRATNICEVDSMQEYGMVRLDGVEYLLPAMTRDRFINQDGSEAENTVTFSACREFRGESVVTFGGKPAIPEDAKRAEETNLATGLSVAVVLTSTIDADQAAAGDRIEGVLAAPIYDLEKKNVLVDKGKLVEGRLMRVEKRYGNPSEVTIVLRWETLDLNGAKSPITLAPDWHTASKMVDSPGELRKRPLALILPRQDESRYAAYHIPGEHVVVRGGLRSEWFTVQP